MHASTTHMHCCPADSLQLSATQSWCSLECEWLRRSLFQHAQPQSTHMHCFVHCRFLQLRCSTVLVRLGVRWLRRSVFRHARLNPRLRTYFVHCRFLRLSAAQSWVQPGREWLRRSCFSMHTPQSRTCVAFLSTADSLRLQCNTQSWCSLEREWLRRVGCMHASIPRTCIAFRPLQLQCSTVLVQPGAWYFRRSLFSMHA
jgi:hypothetical protein